MRWRIQYRTVHMYSPCRTRYHHDRPVRNDTDDTDGEHDAECLPCEFTLGHRRLFNRRHAFSIRSDRRSDQSALV